MISLCALAFSTPVRADPTADNDTTPVHMCGSTPAAAVLDNLSASDTKSICRAMGLLDGVRVGDIRAFSKAFVVLSHEGCEGSAADITKQLVAIVRLRGFYDKPDRWYSTLDIVVRTYQAFNGVVSPSDVIALLAAAGAAAKGLSDEGFKNMLIVLKERKQQGAD
jgi:hypothetical protein